MTPAARAPLESGRRSCFGVGRSQRIDLHAVEDVPLLTMRLGKERFAGNPLRADRHRRRVVPVPDTSVNGAGVVAENGRIRIAALLRPGGREPMAHEPYDGKQIEQKWQERWGHDGTDRTDLRAAK